jgi:hypothetical protein
MEIIWIAILLYSIGLAIVLYLRPALMFNENGTWKEFGYKREEARYTIFPFWLFAVVWAFLAYALAAVMGSLSMSMVSVASVARNVSWSDEETDEEFERVSEKEKTKKPRPGYYVLNAGTKKGIRKYVYYGQEPPE